MATSSLVVANNALIRLGAKKISALTEDTDRARLCDSFYSTVRQQTLRAHPWNVALKRTLLNTFPNASINPASAAVATGVEFVASQGVFLAGRDEGALIVEHPGRAGQARITSVTDTQTVIADIEVEFSTAGVIPVEEWRIAPSFEWPYRYLKPTDYLRAAKVQGTSGTSIPGFASSGFQWSWWSRGQRDNSPEPFKVENETLVSNLGPKLLVQYVFDLTDTTKWDALLEEAITSLLAFRIAYGVTGSLQAGKTHHDAWKESLAEARSIDGQEGTGDDTGSDVLLAVRG